MPRPQARKSIQVEAEPRDVYDFAVYDLRSLADWLSSVESVTGADGNWPAVGSSYTYTRTVGNQTVEGRTTVLEAEPPRRIVTLEQVTVGEKTTPPELAGRSTWTFEPEGAGTLVTMDLVGTPLSLPVYVLYSLLFHRRTESTLAGSLANLKRVCEEELEDASGA